MQERFFECPCGVEFFNPNRALGPEFTPPRFRDCHICGLWIARWVMWLLQTGSAEGVGYRFQAFAYRVGKRLGLR